MLTYMYANIIYDNITMLTYDNIIIMLTYATIICEHMLTFANI